MAENKQIASYKEVFSVGGRGVPGPSCGQEGRVGE